MAKTEKFSVIIPTYTGEEHISKCFNSLLSQKGGLAGFEVIVVIDGPNDSLRAVVDAAAEKFRKRGIDFTVHQFKKNRGRLEARLKGAETARHEQLLFVDDRVALSDDYMAVVSASGENLLIPNVLEAEARNGVSRGLYLLRRRIYGEDKFGADFKSFYIDKANFEKSPKGTTSLWISRQDFINASQAIAKETSNRDVNDDTKLFKYLIGEGKKIYKSSQAKIYYNPRSSAWAELDHLFGRGPKFVDYYAQPGTRFFGPLIMSIVLALAFLLAAVFYPVLLVWVVGIILAADILLTAVTSEKAGDLRMLVFYPLIVLAFTLGVAKGLIGKARTIRT